MAALGGAFWQSFRLRSAKGDIRALAQASFKRKACAP